MGAEPAGRATGPHGRPESRSASFTAGLSANEDGNGEGNGRDARLCKPFLVEMAQTDGNVRGEPRGASEGLGKDQMSGAGPPIRLFSYAI